MNTARITYAHALVFYTLEIAFTRTCLLVIYGAMLKCREVEICVECVVDAVQQVQVETFGNTSLVVICGQYYFRVFYKVKARKYQVAGRQMRPKFFEKIDSAVQ